MMTIQQKVNERLSEVEWLSPRRFLLLLVFAVVLGFPKVITGFSTFFFQDFGTLGYPYGAFFRASILQGEIPFWNPYSHCGVPFLAQWGTLYPPGMLGTMLPLPWSANVLTLAHLVWGGMGMYWLMRNWGLGSFAAGFAGMAYAFNGVTMSCHVWGNYVASLSWQPWIVLWVMQAWRQGGRWIVLAALAGTMQVLTATPEITLLGWLIVGCLWVVECFSKKIVPLKSALAMASIILLVSALVMVQMLPFLDLLQNSQRDISAGTSQKGAMPAWGWANLVLPLFHYFETPRGAWFQTGQHFMTSYYPGAGVLLLAVAGVWLKRNVLAFLLASLALFFWTMALGSSGHLYDLISAIVPQIDIARYQVKYAIPAIVVLCPLAALAIDRLCKSNDGHARRTTMVVAAGVVLLIAGMALIAALRPFTQDDVPATMRNAIWRVVLVALMVGGLLLLCRLKTDRSRWILQTAILALLPIDALTHVPNIIPTLPSSVMAPGMWEAAGNMPPPKLGEGRIMISPNAEDYLLYKQVEDNQSDFIGRRLAEWSNLNLVDRIPKVTGAMTLRPAHFDKIEQYLYYTVGSISGFGLADFLSAAWISAPDNPVLWIERTNYLHVITAGQKPVFAADPEVLTNITAMDFDPRSVVYLPEEARGHISVTNHSEIQIERVEFGLNEVEAEIAAVAPGMVVLSQSYYPHWEAYLDGERIPLLRANLAFQAVEVPAGQHVLRIEYRDPNFLIGGGISVLGLLICAVMWLRSGPLPKESLQNRE